MTLHGRGSVPSSTAVSVPVVSRRRSGASMSGEDDLELCADVCLVGSLIWRRRRLLVPDERHVCTSISIICILFVCHM